MTSASLLAATASTGGGLAPLILFVLPIALLVWMWWLNRRRAQEVQARQSALQVGQRVVMTSGLIGTLVSREAGEARLEVAPGVVLTFDERALMAEAPTPTHHSGGASADPTAPSKEAD